MSLEQRRRDDDMFWKVVKAWPLLVALVTVGVTIISFFTLTKNRLEAHELALVANSADHAKILDRLARMEAITDMLPEMRSDIKRLLVRREDK